MDRLSPLLSRFSLNAGIFHSGALCGISAFSDDGQEGHLHLLRQGQLKLYLEGGRELRLAEPTLIFLPTAAAHRFSAGEEDGAELVCAAIRFDGGRDNPIARALPRHVVLPLTGLGSLAGTLDWLFAEAFAEHCGRDAVINRLCELLVIQLLRHLMDSGDIQGGMLAGLADPRLAKVLNHLHAHPASAWPLEEQAALAGMSRARYAAYFKAVLGETPGDYLLYWRVALAQKLLREGRSIKLVAGEVGYESPSALARAFRRVVGVGPMAWVKQAHSGIASASFL